MKQTFVLVVAGFALLAGPSHAGTVPGQYIVVLKDGANSHAAAQRARKLGGDVFAEYGVALHGYAARLSDSQLASVEADPSVQFVRRTAPPKSPVTSRRSSRRSCPTTSTGSTAS